MFFEKSLSSFLYSLIGSIREIEPFEIKFIISQPFLRPTLGQKCQSPGTL